VNHCISRQLLLKYKMLSEVADFAPRCRHLVNLIKYYVVLDFGPVM